MKFPAKAAVTTRYLGATTCLPSRIRVKSRNLPAIFVSIHNLTDDDVTGEELHRLAVIHYLKKLDLNWGDSLMGWTGDEYVHVFIPHGYVIVTEKFATR
jgi:hypothetical protein